MSEGWNHSRFKYHAPEWGFEIRIILIIIDLCLFMCYYQDREVIFMILHTFEFLKAEPNTHIPEIAHGNRSTVQEIADTSGHGSAQHVIAHARRQNAKGKSPSMSFDGILNPRDALVAAEAKLAADLSVDRALQAASIAIEASRGIILDNIANPTQEQLDKLFGEGVPGDVTEHAKPEANTSHRATVQEIADTSGHGSAQHVIAHARRQNAKGKSPSMSFDGNLNPRKALAAAEAKVATENQIISAAQEAQRILSRGQAELASTMQETDRVVFIDWTGGTNAMPRMGGYVIPRTLATHYEELHQAAVAGPDHSVYNEIHDQGYPSINFGSPEGTNGRWGGVIEPEELCGKLALETIRVS